MKIHIIQNVLQNVLTLINRLCIAICLKFHQSKILVIILATKAWRLKISAYKEKRAPPPRMEKITAKKRKKVPQKALNTKKGPPQEGERGPTNRLFSREIRVFSLKLQDQLVHIIILIH